MLNENQMREMFKGASTEQLKQYLEIKEQEAAQAATPFDKPVDWPKTNSKSVGKDKEIEVPYTCVENTGALLDHFGITAKYNEMSKEVEIDIPHDSFHRDTALNNKLTWIINQAHHKGLPKSELDEHIALIANKHAYHPVRDWILSKPWDGVSRLQAFYDSVASDTELKELYMQKWGVMAVAAVFEVDGIRPQGVLTFEGIQGKGKTRWLSSIAGNPKWIAEGQSLDPHDKDSVLEVVSKWIVELGEIQATFSRADIQSLKAFITKNEDRIRPPYAEKVNMYARRTVFYGTVDEANFLNDKNGTRRFWVVSVDDVNVNHGIDCQQLWAEFHELWKSGEQYWMNQDEIRAVNEANEQYVVLDPIEERLQRFCVIPETESGQYGAWLNATAVLMAIGIKSPSKSDTNTAAKWLRKQGALLKKEHKQYFVRCEDPDGVHVQGMGDIGDFVLRVRNPRGSKEEA